VASILKAAEVNRARVGPRELKDPRSREYAIQTLYALKRSLQSVEIDKDHVYRELAEIEQYRHWEVLGYPSKDVMLEAETGHTPEQIQRKLKTQGAPIGNQNASKSKAQNKVGNTKFVGHTVAYTLARLDRDAPALAAKVRAGELKANAAAIQAGFRTRTHTIPHDVPRAAATLKRVFTTSEVKQLKAQL
jgi:hypothetical protein